MLTWPLTPTCTLVITRGDLTRADVDAVVNAANSGLLGGGGVDGALHRAAGPELLEACRRLPRVAGVRCPPGQARLTPGFELPARFVIHTVGPVFGTSPAPAAVLASAHAESLRLANQAGLRSVAFPAISCGVYGYPMQQAAPVALTTCRAHAGALTEIRFVLYSAEALQAWEQAATALLGPPGPET